MRDLEHKAQSALIEWWRITHKQYGLPEFALFAIPNGGARSVITGAKLKREGVRKGVFDLRLEVIRNGNTGMYIEMKYGKNKLTKEQEQFMLMATAAGAHCVVCYSWDDAAQKIRNYLGIDR